MTFLPVPALSVTPDATEKAPPQCESPALQDAQEITLAEVVEGLAHISSPGDCRPKKLTWLPKIRLPRRPVSGQRFSTYVRSWPIWSPLS
jgi:hypothetical protein